MPRYLYAFINSTSTSRAVQMRLPAPGQFRLRPPAPAGQFRRRPPAPARQFRLGHQNQGSSDRGHQDQQGSSDLGHQNQRAETNIEISHDNMFCDHDNKIS